MKCLFKLITIVCLVTPVISDCLQLVSTSNWSILSRSIISYGIGDKFKEIPDVVGYELATIICEDNFVCNVTSTVPEASKEPIFNRDDIAMFFKTLFIQDNYNNTKIFKITFNYVVYESALSRANFSKGYFFMHDIGLLHLWYTNYAALLTYHEGPANEFVLDDNPSRHYVTFVDNRDNFTLQILEKTNGDFWTTDHPFLFLMNNTEKSFNSYLKLSRKIIPEKNLKVCTSPVQKPEQITVYDPTDMIIGIVIGVIGSIIIIYLIYRYVKKRKRSRQEPLRQSFFNKITDHALYQYLFYKKKNNTKEEEEHEYEEPIEANEYTVPYSNERKVYDIKGKRIQIENQEPNIYDYDYTYSHLRPNQSNDRASEISYIELTT